MADADCNTQQIEAERLDVAIEASCELEALVLIMKREMDERNSADDIPLNGLIARIKGLNSIVLSAIGDESEPLPSCLASDPPKLSV